MGKDINKDSVFKILLGVLCAVAIASVGLFHEWTSCAVSVLLSVWLFAKILKLKSFSFNLNLTSISAIVTVFIYGISVFWAVDKGMAFVGFLKFLPVLLFCLSLFIGSGAEEFIKRYLPVFIAALVVVCASLMQIPALKDYFSVAGRFSGSFQYPNAFALLVLVAELLVFSAPFKRFIKIILFAVLIFGLIYTGSRTVFVLALVANLCVILWQIKFSKKAVFLSLALFFAAVAVSIVLAFVRVYPFDRLLTISFSESTFIGRLLYFKDAAPVILKHPFGLGYLGYFYTQTTFQTGVYSVKYIHNDILQIALDIGWIPAVLLVCAVLKSIFSRGVPFENRVILSVMFLHSLFDFDLQFIALFMLMFVFMKRDCGKSVKCDKAAPLFVITLLSLASLYFSVALGLYSFGKTEAANGMYPYNTDNKIKMLMGLDESEDPGEIADSIIEQNEYVYYAYGEKARNAYKQGDFEQVIKYKNLLFDYAPLVYDEYEEYCYMLINGIALYNEAGDFDSAEICRRQLIATKKKYTENLETVSDLGYKTKDKPNEKFPDDIEEYIEKLKQE